MKSVKKKTQIFEDSIESKTGGSVKSNLTNLAKDTGKSFWDEWLLGTMKQLPQQAIFGVESNHGNQKGKFSGELEEGKEVALAKQEKKAAHNSQHQEYFREINNPEQKRQQEQATIVQKINEILLELKKLTNSASEMKVVHKEIAAEQAPVKAGIYHLNFYEFLLTVLRSARIKLDEGASWKTAFASKKKQRSYGAMAKKHGTSYTLSSERSTVTQTG